MNRQNATVGAVDRGSREEDYANTRSEFIRRVKFQVSISKALDRALQSPSRNPEAQRAIVGALLYCLNELDVAFANPHTEFPDFSESAYRSTLQHALIWDEGAGEP